MGKNILDVLEKKIDEAIRLIVHLRKRNRMLVEENRNLQALLVEQEHRIKDLLKAINDQDHTNSAEVVKEYKETEEILRERIKKILLKLEELKSLQAE